VQVNNLPQQLRFELTHLQTRSAWDFVLQACIVLNTEKTKPSIIVTLLTQIGLLLIMLIGLLRLLHDGVGAFALGSLLWKQVGSEQSHFAVSQLTCSNFLRVLFGS
jgi:hypothetical protein